MAVVGYLILIPPDPSLATEQFVNALTLGALYALIALGYTMVYGIIELINFAHGDIFMVGLIRGDHRHQAAGLYRNDPRSGRCSLGDDHRLRGVHAEHGRCWASSSSDSPIGRCATHHASRR